MQGDTCKNTGFCIMVQCPLERLNYYSHFGDGMRKSGETFILAHVERSKRQNSPPFPGKGL